jgi:glucose-1-phosphate thymidylyltransferase
MKAAVLARGLGRRMRERDPDANLSNAQVAAAMAGAKAMMPIAGDDRSAPRPFLDYVLASLADAGMTEVALVVGPEHDAVRTRYARPGEAQRLAVSCLEQREPRGTADAVLSCEPWTGREPFIVVNGDNLYPVAALRALRDLDTPGLPVFERDDLVASSNIPASRIAAFALVHVSADGWLERIEEKPDVAALARSGGRALISMNCWRFDARIFEACRDVAPSSRGEFELPHAVALALTRGVEFRAVPGRGPVLDLSRQGDVSEVAQRLASQSARW